jgi:hypothetical protein
MGSDWPVNSPTHSWTLARPVDRKDGWSEEVSSEKEFDLPGCADVSMAREHQ